LRHVRYGVSIGENVGAQAGDGADIGDEAILRRAVMLRDRARIGPGTKEELQEASVEEIEKAREGVITHQPPTEAFIGGGDWQRALWPQKPEKFDEYPDPAGMVVDRREVRGGELEIGHLAEVDIFVATSGTVTNPRPIRVGALEL